jgi:hypothetical protein
MEKLYKNALLLVGLLALSTLFNFALVQVGSAQLPIQTPPQTTALTQGQTIREVIANIFKWVFLILTWIAGALAVIYIIWGGINVIIQGKIDEGKNRLIYGIVGLVIALISFALVKLIETIVVTGGVGE